MASLNEKVSQHYDDNEKFASVLAIAIERALGYDFEYTDWSHRSIGEIVAKLPPGYAMTVGKSLGADMADVVKERLFVLWVEDNYKDMEAQSVLDQHVQSGDYPDEFLREIFGGHPFNDTSNGIFADHYLDRDGIPVGDTFVTELRTVLHGAAAKDWTRKQNADLAASMSGDEMVEAMGKFNFEAGTIYEPRG